METTKNKMPPYAKDFFDRLKNYLNTKIYYYGSIQRIDYFPKSSDIDVDIFTDNETSTISKLQNFLGVNRYEFKTLVYRLHKTDKLIRGHKVLYKDKFNNFITEISIYNNKYKDDVLLEHSAKFDLPLYISFLLIVLKFLYYNTPILPKEIYLVLKNIVLDYMVEGKNVEFIITEIPKDKEYEEKRQQQEEERQQKERYETQLKHE
jgi:hypothetical protein